MAVSILGPLNKVINRTTTAVIDNQITQKMSDVVNTFVNSGFEVVEDVLKKVQDLTKPEEP